MSPFDFLNAINETKKDVIEKLNKPITSKCLN